MMNIGEMMMSISWSDLTELTNLSEFSSNHSGLITMLSANNISLTNFANGTLEYDENNCTDYSSSFTESQISQFNSSSAFSSSGSSSSFSSSGLSSSSSSQGTSGFLMNNGNSGNNNHFMISSHAICG